jgi:hypothetical protein
MARAASTGPRYLDQCTHVDGIENLPRRRREDVSRFDFDTFSAGLGREDSARKRSNARQFEEHAADARIRPTKSGDESA